MVTETRLSTEQLYCSCDPELLPFKTTSTLEPFTGFFGQDRALEAMEFGIGMRRPGYNLFVMGTPHTGRFSFAMENLKAVAKKEKKPTDWIYLNNLKDNRHPLAISFPAGKAQQFKRDIKHIIEGALTEMPAAFESPTYQRKKSKIERDFNRYYDHAIDAVEREAREHSIAVYRDAGTIGFTPVADGQAMDEAAFSQLTEEARAGFTRAISELEDQLNEALTGLPQWRREAAEKLKNLDRDTTREAISPLFQPIKEKYANLSAAMDYLAEMENSLVKNCSEIVGDDKVLEPVTDAARRNYMESNYGVNLLVDNVKTKGAPVVYEAHPSYENLFGRVEYNTEMGALSTNYKLIRSGALHQANGGYLVMEAEKLLEQPFVYGALKRALKSHEISIESPASEYTGISTITLLPQAVPLTVKIVLVGSRDIYYLLQELDHDFEKMFRVVVDFDEDVKRTPQMVRSYARLMKTLADEEGLAPLTRRAVARLVEHSSRQAQNQALLSAHIGELVDLLCEADFKRIKEEDELINADHVEMALNAKERRTARMAEKIEEGIVEETVLIDTEGEAIGKANGLTVLQVGDVAFGTPARITATVYPGNRGIVDIEREVTLGQPIHSKGVLILSGFLGNQYAKDFPMAMSASIALEQSYGYVDGDSASLAEVCTLISALTHIPISQNYATTGSINQYGEVQAIGGVNEKIEGFFNLCKARGLNGEQGVVIPKANIRNLMLKAEVVEAVRQGEFSVYAVSHVDQCLEVLMGRKAGKLKEDGTFTQRSINAQVVKRLREISSAKAD
ncbi:MULTISPECIES: Lon protease family protein [unclassified Neptuniibacter]|jgi:predicted ATP-dependent protease|uniref:Lon protease family protein n=1 Tax=unclassified Neptuniibacter TaxID=2630693 RepID=UPI0026E3ED28|nr:MULTISPECIES: ATP-binding protein [unclassified Neptuniibacter]MDO6514078.1 ATP-binding protein [Neptuniibacter sp. 2_MG-2023]MDO6594085.1 ATP-binding protein [Neptuniibacter sp. 1_MG-2023]